MLIGGKASGSTAVLGTTLMRVPAKKVLDVVIKTIELYKNSRGEKENMVDWMDRVVRGDGPGGLKSSMELKSHLEPLTVIPPVELAPEAYVDWGNDEKFRAKTAKGECAA
jgi:sulfite reductase (ferredoxin)|tara:strand:+ start:218 stop:547 length:330 start_codon:yes stop_codon:yes gene_type:complete